MRPRCCGLPVSLGDGPAAPRDWAAAFAAAVASVGELGGAKRGDRTMLDALEPASEAFTAAIDAGLAPQAAWQRAIEAAEAGTAATATMFPRAGRAAYLGGARDGRTRRRAPRLCWSGCERSPPRRTHHERRTATWRADGPPLGGDGVRHQPGPRVPAQSHRRAARGKPGLDAAGGARRGGQADPLLPVLHRADAASRHPGRFLRRQRQGPSVAAAMASQAGQ